MTLADGRRLFGKIYSTSHERADRWYRFGRTILCLALRTDPERVYARATRVFTPDELAEALACAVGLAIPTELQAKLKADGRPLLERFRRLAPAHPPVSIQRWSPQRLTLTGAAVVGTLLLVGLFLDALRAGLG